MAGSAESIPVADNAAGLRSAELRLGIDVTQTVRRPGGGCDGAALVRPAQVLERSVARSQARCECLSIMRLQSRQLNSGGSLAIWSYRGKLHLDNKEAEAHFNKVGRFSFNHKL